MYEYVVVYLKQIAWNNYARMYAYIRADDENKAVAYFKEITPREEYISISDVHKLYGEWKGTI